uniref:Uncharacterized protein n=1 Tax=Grammatophora oceanica TaxID=210454 RepID=A0A7S1VR72_9STRA
MASSGAYMSKQSSADGEKESHDTAPCTEDENSTPKSSTSSIGGGAGGAGAFLGGWGFMKNLGKEQVAEKSSSKTKKFKKSSFTPNAVNWREAPPKRRTQIASLKKTALISEDAKCQKRFRWGRDLLGEAFQPYRHMLCGSDDLLPDQDQFHAFAVDAEEADQGREAYVRTLMLQNGELSEREVAAFFEGLALFKVKNRALESQLVCVDAVRRFESEHSTVTTENEWESSIEGDNNVALRQVRRHMPVNIRSLTENQSVLQPSPTGKTLPKRFAKKFKQANVLQLIRMSPDDITKLHPASLENLRVQGLTLTERRALHAHLKVVGPVWKELNQREKDPLSERKYNWFVMMKQQFKEHLDSYTKHVEEYGPPGNHPYATRSNDKQGCPLIGKQCPLKADKLLDYSLDYGYPEGDIYEQVASATETDDTSVVDPKKEEAREKRAAERSEILSRHYQGKALKAALAVCACQEMDDAIDRLAKRQARWVKNQVINQHYDVTGDEWREIEACQAALKDIRHFVCKMVERAGLKLTFQTRVNARESLDTRSVMEIGLSEEVCDYSRDFLNNMESRFEMLGNGIGDLKIELTAVRALLKEIQDRNAGSLRNLGARRPKQTVLLKSRDELEAMVRKRMKAALQQSSTSASDGTSTFHESMESYPSYTVSLKGSSDGDSPRSRNTKMNMLAEFTSRMEVESVISGMTPVREEPVGATVQDETPAPVENTPLSRRSSLAPGGEKSPAAVNRRASLPGALKPADRENARTPPLVPTKSTPTGSTRSSPIISPRISPKQESKTTVSGSPRISPKQSTQTTVTTSAESSPKQEDKTAAVVSASSPRTSPSLTKRATPSSSPGVSPGQAKRATVRTSSDSEALKARVAALTAKKTARADATSTAAGNTAATRNSAPRQSMAELKASIAKRKEARAAAAAAAAATATGDEQ